MNVYHEYDLPPDTRRDIVQRVSHDTILIRYRCEWCRLRRWFAKDLRSNQLLCSMCFEKALRWSKRLGER
jgi:hypothetical protein